MSSQKTCWQIHLIEVIMFVLLAWPCVSLARAQHFTIAASTDISTVAMVGDLSSYSPDEIAHLPRNIRKSFKIIVSSDISKQDLKDTFMALIRNEAQKDHNIDEIVVFAYDNDADVNSVYTLGKAEWCPGGVWSAVTPTIASTNDRSGYKYAFDIRSKVGMGASGRPTAYEMKVYHAYVKELWADESIDEDVVARRISHHFRISKKKLNDIFIKVTAYKLN